ncbi:MAG: glycosyltransferase family 4 protein [Deltaproteobacteria bacterium]|nr:MAG: glycosyltransferase family 4 protein [Deltaproteobacteria bacterium]
MVQAFGPLTFGLSAAALVVSAAGVWYSIRLAHRIGVVDVPNERSSHDHPTPRMGGVPMVAAVALTFGCWVCLVGGGGLHVKGLSTVLGFAFLMSVLGFWDDVSGLSPLFRFLVQFAAAVLFLGAASFLFPKVVLAGSIFPTAVWVLASSLWIQWMLNLYNFMDGIDGIAGGEAAVASSFFFFVFSHYGESGWAVANLLVGAAAMGFLIHNWPPAKIFMGDSGSAFLGAFFGMQSVLASLSTPVPFPVLVLPFANFILDTTATLFRRMWRGEKWYLAHRNHYYQRLVASGMSHRKVTVLELSSVVVCCIAGLAYLNAGFSGRLITIILVIALFASIGMWIQSRLTT